MGWELEPVEGWVLVVGVLRHSVGVYLLLRYACLRECRRSGYWGYAKERVNGSVIFARWLGYEGAL